MGEAKGHLIKLYAAIFSAVAAAVLSSAGLAMTAPAPGLHVQQCALGTYCYEGQWSDLGAPYGRLSHPVSLDTDAGRNVYIADDGNDRVLKVSPGGAVLWSYGDDRQAGVERLQNPTGVAVSNDGQSVYVTDSDNCRIVVLSAANGGLLQMWGEPGAEDGNFFFPNDVEMDGAGNLYVADSLNDRVQKFTADGRFIDKWGRRGVGNGHFHWPMGLTAGTDGDIYVSDTFNHRIQRFTAAGQYVAQWGERGAANGQFESPVGIATGQGGTLFVADMENDRVQKFTAAGRFLTKWGREGRRNGQFSSPMGVTVSSSSRAYVADSGNDRIQWFRFGVKPKPAGENSSFQFIFN